MIKIKASLSPTRCHHFGTRNHKLQKHADIVFLPLQVWESIPNHLPKLSRPPSLADVHLPHYSDLPKPDLAKKLNSLHAHFSALPKTLKTLTPTSGLEESSSNVPKMEGIASKLKRRGWCGCLRDDEPPEITYCVVDGAGTLSLQAVTPSLPMPADEDELNAKFAELVVRHSRDFALKNQGTPPSF